MEYSYFRTIIFLILLAVGGYFVFRFFSFRVIIFLFLLAVSGYYVLWFFSKLTGINMFSAIAWIFQAKQWMLLIPVFFLAFFYLAFFISALDFFKKPAQIFEMNKYHAGGLLGYWDTGSQAKVYDPSKNSYIAYDIDFWHGNLRPLPVYKFTEAFEVI